MNSRDCTEIVDGRKNQLKSMVRNCIAQEAAFSTFLFTIEPTVAIAGYIFERIYRNLVCNQKREREIERSDGEPRNSGDAKRECREMKYGNSGVAITTAAIM